ncbi:hypothetical protein WJX77_008580 [Trebouxia sp. C0004]
MQLVTAAAASDIRNASAQVRADYNKNISILEDCLAEDLCYVRYPYTAWTDIKPHWLDHIAHVQNVLKRDSSLGVQGKGLKNSGQDVYNRARISGDEQLLMAYQGSPLWDMKGLPMNTSLYSPNTTAWEDKHAALSSLQAVRGICMSAQSLAQHVEANATKGSHGLSRGRLSGGDMLSHRLTTCKCRPSTDPHWHQTKEEVQLGVMTAA